MVDVVCRAIAGLADTAVSAEACLGALAAIRAAKIQAHSATLAGWLTLGASAGAVLAGYITYRAALEAANVQVRLAEKQDKLRQEILMRQCAGQMFKIFVEVKILNIRVSSASYVNSDITLLSSLKESATMSSVAYFVSWEHPKLPKDFGEKVEELFLIVQCIVTITSIFDELLQLVQERDGERKRFEAIENLYPELMLLFDSKWEEIVAIFSKIDEAEKAR